MSYIDKGSFGLSSYEPTANNKYICFALTAYRLFGHCPIKNNITLIYTGFTHNLKLMGYEDIPDSAVILS